jgi:hypothetical protein
MYEVVQLFYLRPKRQDLPLGWYKNKKRPMPLK